MSHRLFLHLRRNPQRHQKPRHHVVSGNRARQLDDLRGVEMLVQSVENFVSHLDVKRHLRGVLNYQLFDQAERFVCCAQAGIAFDHDVERIEFSLRAARCQKIGRMVFVFVRRASQQRYGANAEFAQFGAGRQVGSHGFQVHVPAARQRLAIEQDFVEVDRRAAQALKDRVNQV